MRPKIIMHMAISIDGRIVPTPWPKDISASVSDIYERIHRDLDSDGWIVGRVTMAEFADGAPQPLKASQTFPRTTWNAQGVTNGPFAIAVDESGKLHLNRSEVNGDPLVAILTEKVSDDHLAELRRDGISYLFAGQETLDLDAAMERLAEDFGLKSLLLEGGGGINGSFLKADLIDEVSLLIAPIADGSEGPTLFTGGPIEARRLALESVERLEDDFLHLRYRVQR